MLIILQCMVALLVLELIVAVGLFIYIVIKELFF